MPDDDEHASPWPILAMIVGAALGGLAIWLTVIAVVTWLR